MVAKKRNLVEDLLQRTCSVSIGDLELSRKLNDRKKIENIIVRKFADFEELIRERERLYKGDEVVLNVEEEKSMFKIFDILTYVITSNNKVRDEIWMFFRDFLADIYFNTNERNPEFKLDLVKILDHVNKNGIKNFKSYVIDDPLSDELIAIMRWLLNEKRYDILEKLFIALEYNYINTPLRFEKQYIYLEVLYMRDKINLDEFIKSVTGLLLTVGALSSVIATRAMQEKKTYDDVLISLLDAGMIFSEPHEFYNRYSDRFSKLILNNLIKEKNRAIVEEIGKSKKQGTIENESLGDSLNRGNKEVNKKLDALNLALKNLNKKDESPKLRHTGCLLRRYEEHTNLLSVKDVLDSESPEEIRIFDTEIRFPKGLNELGLLLATLNKKSLKTLKKITVTTLIDSAIDTRSKPPKNFFSYYVNLIKKIRNEIKPIRFDVKFLINRDKRHARFWAMGDEIYAAPPLNIFFDSDDAFLLCPETDPRYPQMLDDYKHLPSQAKDVVENQLEIAKLIDEMINPSDSQI